MTEFSDVSTQTEHANSDGRITVPDPTSSAHDADCELCEAARFTHWYHEDDLCWVADCEVCAVPMVVWKPHGIAPSEAEVTHMLERLAAAAGVRFGEAADDVAFDGDRRSIPDHRHVHARDQNWFAERNRRAMSRYTGVGTQRNEP